MSGRSNEEFGRWQWGLGVLIPVHILLLAWLSCRMSPTSDEVAHLAAGVRIWQLGTFDEYYVNPPLVKYIAAAPVVLQNPRVDWKRHSNNPADRREWNVGQDFIYANSTRSLAFFTFARWACMPFSILGMLYCFWWARILFGARAGVVAATFWCFSPTILGNAALLTPDVAATSLGLATAYHFRFWLLKHDWRHLFMFGVFLGLAQLSKMTWLLAFIGFPLMWFLYRTLFESDRFGGRRFFWEAGQLGVSLILSLYLLNLGYGFAGTGTPLGKYEFVSQALAGKGVDVGNKFAGRRIGTIPVPLPKPYVIGLDLQKRDFEGGWRPMYSYLRGEHRLGGWWYYYLYCFGVKLPVGTLFVLLLAFLWIFHDLSNMGDQPVEELFALLALPTMLLIFISMQTGFSRYFRYAMPVLPFLFIWMSVLWAETKLVVVNPWPRRLGNVGVWATIAASLYYYPHSLAFFNVIAGGPEKGHLHLLDANVDWGQDLYELKDWLNAHRDRQPLWLAYSGVIDPKVLGIDHPFPPVAEGDIPKLAPGWYVLSVNHIHGYDEESPRWKYFEGHPPADRIGYSLMVYHVGESNEFLPQ